MTGVERELNLLHPESAMNHTYRF